LELNPQSSNSKADALSTQLASLDNDKVLCNDIVLGNDIVLRNSKVLRNDIVLRDTKVLRNDICLVLRNSEVLRNDGMCNAKMCHANPTPW